MNFNKKIIPLVLATTVSQSCIQTMAFADSSIDNKQASYGYYIDNWSKNSSINMTPDINPSIGVLSEFLKIFTPGSSWNNGTVLNKAVHEHNINTVIDMTSNNTTAAAVSTTSGAAQVYLDDRRDQNYSITEGLGRYTDLFRKLASAGTTIPNEVPQDATTKQYTDKGNSNGKWADESSELGNMVTLIDTLRGASASTSQAKSYYKYMRPYRWSTDVKVLPTLVPEKNSDPSNDGGFPSGHTNAAYISAIGLAYAAPERFQEMLTRASELGNDRIRAGMHSPLDVIGGRTMATAISVAALNNTANATLKAAAYNEAQTKLFTQEGTSKDRFSDYKENKKNYIDRLTYGFDKIGATDKPMVVPKGAEVLLETRLPYLDAKERREVLYTTGIGSGYPVLDDAEGWGRLNLFAAADGYGAFNDTVTVNMDASKGGFNSVDSWRNDISGTGALIKEGTGTLKLEGDNVYSGGTQIHKGTLEADSSTAFGKGSITNDGGTLVENVSGIVSLNNEYKQSENGTLELSIGNKNDVFEINGNATFFGKLKLDFNNDYIPDNNITIIKFKSNSQSSKFSSIETTDLPDNYKVSLVYGANDVKLLIEKSDSSNNSTSSSSTSHHHSSNSSSSSSSNEDKTITNINTNEVEKDNIRTNEVKLGWQQKNGTWYNLSKEGTVNTGWFKDKDGKWYYLNKSGDMQTGWVKDTDGQWYYLNQSGAMEYNKYIDGYYLGSNGSWVK